MKRRMRYCIAGILSILILSMTAGCSASQYNGQNPVHLENEVPTETVSVKESEINKEKECPETSKEPEPTKSPNEESQETSAMQESLTEDEQQEEKTVLIAEDDGVRDSLLFAAFLDEDIAVYDDAMGKNRYIYEYFADYGSIDINSALVFW